MWRTLESCARITQGTSSQDRTSGRTRGTTERPAVICAGRATPARPQVATARSAVLGACLRTHGVHPRHLSKVESASLPDGRLLRPRIMMPMVHHTGRTGAMSATCAARCQSMIDFWVRLIFQCQGIPVERVHEIPTVATHGRASMPGGAGGARAAPSKASTSARKRCPERKVRARPSVFGRRSGAARESLGGLAGVREERLPRATPELRMSGARTSSEKRLQKCGRGASREQEGGGQLRAAHLVVFLRVLVLLLEQLLPRARFQHARRRCSCSPPLGGLFANSS